MTEERSHELLRRVLAIPTVNGENSEGVLAEFLGACLEKYAVKSEIEKNNITAVIDGKESDHIIVVNGHLDTVPYGDVSLWDTDPAVPVEKDGRIYARGASDMKSGLCAIVSALCELAQSGCKPRRTVIFLGTADEEKNGTGAALAALKRICDNAELLLIGEPTGGAVGTAQKGCLWLQCQVKGQTCHGAYPWEGINAVTAGFEFAEELSKFVEQFTHPLLGNSTLSLNMIEGGVAFNMVPDTCEFSLDIRMVPSLSEEKILHYAANLADCMKLRNKSVSIKFQVKNNRRAVEVLPDNKEVLLIHSCIEQVTKSVQSDIGINFFTDASILVKDRPDIPVILYGPGRPDLAHKPNEYVEFEKYDTAVQVYKEFLQK
jgi:succinyl-diaminopimelate desuccinylase